MTQATNSSHIPFAVFIGKWEGLSKTFDIDGNFLESTKVHMHISWKDENTFQQIEHIDNLYQIGEVRLVSDIAVNGKTAFAETSHLHLQATELTADTYLFRVKSAASHTTLHNIHYFLDRNTRRVITHKFKGGETFVFQVQDFQRIE
jgi:hypothetical protein